MEMRLVVVTDSDENFAVPQHCSDEREAQELLHDFLTIISQTGFGTFTVHNSEGNEIPVAIPAEKIQVAFVDVRKQFDASNDWFPTGYVPTKP